MNQRTAKLIRVHCAFYELPKRIIRKIKKIKVKYNLTITQTLTFIDVTGKMYHEKRSQSNG